MRIVMKNRLGMALKVQELFHGQSAKAGMLKMIKDCPHLTDGDSFTFENDEYKDEDLIVEPMIEEILPPLNYKE